MTSRWVNLATRLTRRYPFTRGRGYFANLLLTGKMTARPAFSYEAIVEAIPEGSIIRARNGIAVRVHRDLMYVGLYLHGEYEARQSRIYQRLVRPGDLVVDAGANFGWYSALFSEAVGAEGHVYAFEPVRYIADIARDTISLNDRSRVVTLEGAGLGESPGSFTVYTFPGFPHGEASASTRGRTDAVPHACVLTSLDEAVRANGIEHIDFMKVDVEGYERSLFLGGRETLSRDDAPLIAFEINDECLEYLDLTPAMVEQTLSELGYTDFFAVRNTVSKVSGLVAGEGDYLAAKPTHRQRLAESLSPT